jgi:NAD(P)-dependent dehydrogenase (short-subunit alcohol dehydrogenase family)
MKTSGLVVLVVDAVSGSGRLVCEKLAAAGHTVFGGYEQPVPECLKYATGITRLPLDVSCDNSVADAITHITKTSQRIDIVVNNLRGPIFGAIEAVHIGIAEQYINKMLIGTARLQNAVLSVMRAQGYGRIINLNSSNPNIDSSFSGWQTAVVTALLR